MKNMAKKLGYQERQECDIDDLAAYRSHCGSLLFQVVEPYINPRHAAIRVLHDFGFNTIEY